MTGDDINWLTERMVLATSVIWLAWEFALIAIRHGCNISSVKLISHVIRTRSAQWNTIPWAWGGLGGHFFGPCGDPVWWKYLMVFLLTAAVVTGDAVVHLRQRQYLDPANQTGIIKVLRASWFVFWAGILVGAALWQFS